MKELARHIEILLLSNDCVIVPGLGGFVAHHVPSHRIEEEGVILPPGRVLGFNSALIMNDGLLAQSYMQAYDSTYPQAVSIIEDKVEEIWNVIDKNGHIRLGQIGSLSCAIDGKLSFEPDETTLITPAYYGLPSLELKTLSSICEEKERLLEAKTEEKTLTTGNNIFIQEEKEVEQRHFTFQIRRSWVYNTVAAAVAAIFFLVISVGDNSCENTLMGISEIITKIQKNTDSVPEPVVITRATKKKETVPSESVKRNEEAAVTAKAGDITEQKAEINSEEQTPAVSKPAENNTEEHTKAKGPFYTIVLASSIPMKNAERFVSELKEMGITAEARRFDDIVRVICNSYPTMDEAQAAVTGFRSKEGLEGAWVLKVW